MWVAREIRILGNSKGGDQQKQHNFFWQTFGRLNIVIFLISVLVFAGKIADLFFCSGHMNARAEKS